MDIYCDLGYILFGGKQRNHTQFIMKDFLHNFKK